MKDYVRINADIVDGIKVVPTGHNTDYKLLDGKNWLLKLWFTCLDTIPTTDSKEALAYHTRHILRCNIDLTDDFRPVALLEIKDKYRLGGTVLGALGFALGPLGIANHQTRALHWGKNWRGKV